LRFYERTDIDSELKRISSTFGATMDFERWFGMIEFRYKGEVLWQRMERAVERVDERLRKTVSALHHPATRSPANAIGMSQRHRPQVDTPLKFEAIR
jgi:hypothetical protein